MTSILPKPYKYKDWLIWEKTSLDEMSYNRVGCSDSINGICLKNLSIKECIEKSDNGIGYHVKFKNGESICVPVRTELYPNLNFVYKLENQENHPEFKDVEVTTFLNKDVYHIPPHTPNAIFFFDILQLENVESELFLGSYPNTNEINFFEKENKNIINVQLIPSYSFASSLIKYQEITYGDIFNIVLPGTSLILYRNPDNNLFEWREFSRIEQQFTFQFSPLFKGLYAVEKENTVVSYGDEFKIIYALSNIVTLNNYSQLDSEYGNINQIMNRNDDNIKNTFRAASKMMAYYCDDNKKCNEINMSKTDTILTDKIILKYYDKNKDGDLDLSELKKLENDIKNKNLNNEIIDRLKIYKNQLNTSISIYDNNKIVIRDSDCLGLCSYYDYNKHLSNQLDYYPLDKLNNKLNNNIKKEKDLKGGNLTKKNNIIIIIIILFILLVFLIIYLSRK
jgi:hypothetical protein